MKIVLGFFLSLLTCALADFPTCEERREQFYKNDPDCVKESGISKEMYDRIDNNKYTGEPEMRKYIACILVKLDLVRANGDPNLGYLKHLTIQVAKNQEEADAIVEKCAQKKQTVEETVYELDKCFHSYYPNFAAVN